MPEGIAGSAMRQKSTERNLGPVLSKDFGVRPGERIELAVSEIEAPYTVANVAKKMNVSPQTVTRIFEREPGVLVIGRTQPGKRTYRSLRIPRHVYERVIRRCTR